MQKNHIPTLLKLILCATTILFSNLSVIAQTRNKHYESYINQYKDIAISEMKRYHIPASITLAQGLLESGAGKSQLAARSNNHFGIKCGSDWKGRTVRHTDDAPNECFRAYKHPRESYEDHSKFLVSRSRYSALFKLKITDYKGWAHGLKKAGYATDPRYAYRLIDLIELYSLHKYDTREGAKWMKEFPNPHQPYLSNGLLYIVVRPNDTFKSIAEEYGLSQRKLRKFNDLPKNPTIASGDILYLEAKKLRAPKENIVHVVRAGESMHSLSQKYGMQLKTLYKLNKKSIEDGQARVGDILRLR
ncbi:MAG: glucosaminidase domain-containing protein [Phocaeicola sp.]